MVGDDLGVLCSPEVVIKLPETPDQPEAFKFSR